MSGIGVPPAATRRSPSAMPAASAGLPGSTPRTRTPVALRQADRAAQATGDVRRRDGDAEVRALVGLAATQRVDPRLEPSSAGEAR